MSVRLVGAFGVSGNGVPAAPARVGSRKARTLLALLAARRGRIVATPSIVEVLWRQDPPRNPARVVATLVSRLRGALGADVVLGGQGGYRLGDPPAIRVDLDEAAGFVEECRAQLAEHPGPAAAAGQRACVLLTGGPALAGLPEDAWVLDVRGEHVALLRAARLAAGEASLCAGDTSTAADLAAAAANADPFDEPAHRLLMAAHQARGEPTRALAVYERLRAALADELGVDPAPETRAVHQAVLTELPAPLGPRSPARSGRAALVGRAAELTWLTEAWSAAAAGRPALVLVAGEGGIGKTRLADEVVATVQESGGLVVAARCYASERSLFVQPLVEALGPVLAGLPAARLRALAGPWGGSLVELLPELGGVLGLVAADGPSPEIHVRGVFEVVTAVLRGLAADRPTLLVLDDLHNAGVATVDLLHYVARHVTASRLLVVATVRSEEGAAVLDALADVARRHDLGPLPAEAVTGLAGAAGRPELAEEILRRTRGHTLFVVESLRGLVSGDGATPDTLQALVLARLRRAGVETEEVLRAGAVLGAAVDPAVVARMLDLPPLVVAQRCAHATAARVLAVAGRNYEFANDLIQEVLYTTTPVPVRIAYHRRAADLLTATPEVVARHAAAAEDWPRAARAFLVAGERALARFAAADADDLLSSALAAAERVGDPELACRGLLARGRAREIRSEYRRAHDDFVAGLATAREAGDVRNEMAALGRLGGHASVGLRIPIRQCTEWLHAGLRIAESLGDRAAEASMLARLAIIETNRLRFVDALRFGRRAAAAGRAARSDRALANGLDGLKTANAYLGESRELADTVAELEPLARRLGDLERLTWTVFESAIPAIAAADWAGAEERIGQALEISRRAGFAHDEPWFVAHLGWLHRLQGRLDSAIEHGRAAAAIRSPAEGWFGPASAALLAGTLVEHGEHGEALACLQDALRRVDVGTAEAYRLRCTAPLAELTGDRALLDESDALLTKIIAPPGGAWLLGGDAYVSVAHAWLHDGEPERARAVLGPLLAAARRQHFVPVLATAGLADAHALVALGDAGASAALAAVATLAERHGLPHVAKAARV